MNEPNYEAGFKKINSVFDHEAEVVSIWDAADLQDADRSPDRFPIGFNAFSDIMKGGVADGDLIVISGKTGHGKTTFAQTLSYHFNKIGIPQLWFSYEVEISELREKFKDMGLDKTFVGYTPLKIKSGNVEWLEERIQEGITKYNTKVVFIDHLGFLTPKDLGSRDYNQNLSAYLGHITRQIKNLARDNRIIIFMLAHTKKTRETLEIEDISHSGGIAQESDFVFMVERIPVERNIRSKSDLDQGEVLSPFTRISLQKNRRTGITKFIKCKLANGRLMENINLDESFKMS